MSQKLALDRIRTDGGTQPRAAIHQDWFEEYARDMADGAKFPPVVVFFDGTDYWLADGFHRYYGIASLELAEIEADVRQGDREDAVVFSLSANAAHGMRRTNEDKRRAVRTALGLQRLFGKADGAIARLCAVDSKTVASVRETMRASLEIPEMTEREVTRGGVTYTQDTTNIGRVAKSSQSGELREWSWSDVPASKSEPSRPVPDSPLWEGRDYDKDWIGITIRQCCEAVERLPAPDQAAADLQIHQSIMLDPAALRAVIAWFSGFLEIREAFEPERRRLFRKQYNKEAA